MILHRTPQRLRFSLSILMGIVLAGSLSGYSAADPQYEDEFPQENAWARISPSVVWCGDPADTVTIEVHIVGRSDVVEVELTNRGEDDRIVLYDDGTHGDGLAGDRVFTASEVVLRCGTSGLKYGNAVGTWHGMLRVRLANGRTAGNNYGFGAGLVHPRFKDVLEVIDFGDGLSATAYAFFIDDSRHEVIPTYPVGPVACGRSNFEAYRKLYSVLPDDFDFVVVTPGLQLFRTADLAENVPYAVSVSNAVEHIGLPLTDNTARFGSAGRLKSAIFESFGDIQIFDHELEHAWGVAIGDDLGLSAGSHWNELSDIGGQASSYFFGDSGEIGHFTDNGDGTWHLRSNLEVNRYSPLELYIMGLIPPEEVPPMHVLTGPDLADLDAITAASVRTVTIDDVIAREGGVRSPGVAESQKDFNLAYMAVQDGPFNEAAYAYFSLMSYALMSRAEPEEYDHLAPFYWATGGRATLNTRLPVELPEPEGLPGHPEPTPTATATALVGPMEQELETAGATATPSEPPAADTPAPSIEGTPTPTPLRDGLARCGLVPIGLVLAGGALRFRRKR